MRIVISIISFLICSSFLQTKAQNLNASSNYKTDPVWIQMMELPTTNYFEIQKAFDTYFKYHELPKIEEEHWGEINPNEFKEKEAKQKLNEKAVEMTVKQKRAAQYKNEMIYQVKRYKEWLRMMAPRVREDGSIMSIDEWLDMTEKQRLEQIEIEQNNK